MTERSETTVSRSWRRGGAALALRRWWRNLSCALTARKRLARHLRRLRRRQDRLERRQARLDARHWDHVAVVNRLAVIERRQDEHSSELRARPSTMNLGAPVNRDVEAAVRRLVCSVVFAGDEAPRRLGLEHYSYHFVYRAFERLLRELFGEHTVVNSPHDLEAAALAATNGAAAVHLAFLPLHQVSRAPAAINAAFVFWEFPEVPNYDVAGNPRNNWPLVAGELDAIFTASSFTQDALRNAGIETPVHLVRVPIQDDYFEVPEKEPDRTVNIDTPCYWFGGDADTDDGRSPTVESRREESFSGRFAQSLELRGTVYTSILNPFDQRKDWPTMLAAFLSAFSDCAEATLVMKFAVYPPLARPALEQFARCRASLAEKTRCRVVVVCEFLSDAQMVELARATTYVVNSSRAEGACLPLQNYLAAGRPAIAPRHTALAEYIDADVGFVVESRREPTHFPFDSSRKITTSWQPVVEESLVEQFAASYRVARREPTTYRTLAAGARRRMADFASYAKVRERFSEIVERIY